MAVRYCKMIADFCDFSRTGCLNVKQGELLTLVDDSDLDWALVMKMQSSEQGFVLKSFIELIDLSDGKPNEDAGIIKSQSFKMVEYLPYSTSSSTTVSSLDQEILLVNPLLESENNLYSGMSKRSAIITEIVETEILINKEMTNLLAVLREKDIQSMLPSYIYAELFSQIPHIQLVSTKLSQNLQQRMDSVPKEQREYLSIGDIFLEEINTIDRAYSLYVINFNENFYEFYSDHKDVFAIIEEAYATLVNNPKNTLGLASVLMKPFHRITRYPILIKSLLESTSPSDPDFRNLQEFMHRVEEILNRSNERRRYKEACEDWSKNLNLKFLRRRAKSLIPRQISVGSVQKMWDEHSEFVKTEMAAIKNLKKRTKLTIAWLKDRLENTKLLINGQTVFLKSLTELIADSCPQLESNITAWMRSFTVLTSEDLLDNFTNHYVPDHIDSIIPQLEKLYARVKPVSKVTHKLEELEEELLNAKKALKAASVPSPALEERKKNAITVLECFKVNLGGELEILQTSGFKMLRMLVRRHFMLTCELYDKIVEPQNKIIEHICDEPVNNCLSRAGSKLKQIDQKRELFCKKIESFLKRLNHACKTSGKANLTARLTKTQPFGTQDTMCGAFLHETSSLYYLRYSMSSVCSNAHRPPNISGPVTNVVIEIKCKQDTEDLATMLDYVKNVDRNAELFRLTSDVKAEQGDLTLKKGNFVIVVKKCDFCSESFRWICSYSSPKVPKSIGTVPVIVLQKSSQAELEEQLAHCEPSSRLSETHLMRSRATYLTTEMKRFSLASIPRSSSDLDSRSDEFGRRLSLFTPSTSPCSPRRIPPKSASIPRVIYAEATHDFNPNVLNLPSFDYAGGLRYLKVSANERVIIKKRVDANGSSDWWLVCNLHGLQGFVPASFLRIQL